MKLPGTTQAPAKNAAKAGSTTKYGKGKKPKVKVDNSPGARRARLALRDAKLARKRAATRKKATARRVRTVSGGLPGLGKR